MKKTSAHIQKVLINLISLQKYSSGDELSLLNGKYQDDISYTPHRFSWSTFSLETTTFSKGVTVLYIKSWTAVHTYLFFIVGNYNEIITNVFGVRRWLQTPPSMFRSYFYCCEVHQSW
jgi:hypothetical protein